jgi:hypothetical protein
MKMSFPRRALLGTVFLRLLCSFFAARFAQFNLPNPVLAAQNLLTSHLLGPSDGWRYYLYGVWDRFDTLWYLAIAAHGYDRPAATVFFPLYPFLIHCVTWITREPTIAALAVSTVACFFLLWGIQELAELDWPGRTFPAVALFVAWPASFILLAGYPESLLIALVVWSVYFARMDRWWLAGILACAAGLTKAAGVMAVIPLAILLLYDRSWRNIPAVALAPLGYIVFTVWLKLSGFPPANAIYAHYWATQIALPWRTLSDAVVPVFRESDWLVGLNLAALLFCVAVLLLAKQMRLDYLLFSTACLILFLTKHTAPPLQSTARYVLLAFPVFLYSASWIKKRTILWIVLIVLCPLYLGMLRTFLWWGLVV